MGRGTRPIYATGMSLDTPEERKAAISAGPKPNCLVLDFAGLVDEHGPVDRVQPRVPGKGMGEAPIKLCPECDEKCHASARVCPCCGYDFPESEKPKHRASASDAAILSTDEPWRRVTGRTFREHQAKDPTKPNTVRVDYMLGFSAQKEWICPGHTGYPKTKADRYWRLHGGRTPFPKSPTEWLDRADELKPTAEIKLRSAGKYDDVIDWRAGEMQADNDNQEPAANDNDLPTWRYARAVDEDALAEFYDEIPF